MKKESGRKVIWIAAGISAAVILLLYTAGVFFFREHFFLNTLIDGENYGWLSPRQTEDAIRSQLRGFVLEIAGRDGVKDTIRAEDIEMAPVFDGSLEEILEGQNRFLWPTAFFKQYSYEIPRLVSFDEELLDEKLKELEVFKKANDRAPQNARIGEYDEESNSYAIVPEDPGSRIKKEEAARAVRDALSTMTETLDLDAAGCFTEPAVKSDNATLTRLVNTLNKYVGTRIVYDWNGAQVIIDGGLIHEWLSVEDKKVVIDEEMVREYINGLARVHDTYGKKRNFMTTDGREIVLSSGAYGWWTDRPGETKEVLKLIRRGKEVNREPLYHCTGYVKGEDDIGSSYVEIDLGSQHLYLYINGELILESDFVSGNMARGYGTPAGVFGITYKERNATLRGQNYASHVDYWMPFNGNIGMHDAGWRRTFGGNIYKTGGSHGCINLPRDMAEQIYEYMEKGFPVICYY